MRTPHHQAQHASPPHSEFLQRKSLVLTNFTKKWELTSVTQEQTKSSMVSQSSWTDQRFECLHLIATPHFILGWNNLPKKFDSNSKLFSPIRCISFFGEDFQYMWTAFRYQIEVWKNIMWYKPTSWIHSISSVRWKSAKSRVFKLKHKQLILVNAEVW